ncbi:hypothetical protein PIB30_103205, partial [Stylosanthes scabra]|nr:hypothetical protein [Stylosanthes scabra]
MEAEEGSERSDVGNMSSLLLPKDMAKKLVVEVVGYNQNDKVGVKVDICDVDTHSMHTLIFKRLDFFRSYVFIGNWVRNFVSRRSFESGNEVGFHWDSYARRFHFSVLARRMNKDSLSLL